MFFFPSPPVRQPSFTAQRSASGDSQPSSVLPSKIDLALSDRAGAGSASELRIEQLSTTVMSKNNCDFFTRDPSQRYSVKEFPPIVGAGPIEDVSSDARKSSGPFYRLNGQVLLPRRTVAHIFPAS